MARCYGSPDDRPVLYDANTAAIANPNMIYPGPWTTYVDGAYSGRC